MHTHTRTAPAISDDICRVLQYPFPITVLSADWKLQIITVSTTYWLKHLALAGLTFTVTTIQRVKDHVIHSCSACNFSTLAGNAESCSVTTSELSEQ